MAKLHAVLAVEDKLKAAANKLQVESIKTLGKEQLFKGHTKRLQMFGDDPNNAAVEEDGYEHRELTSTVDENLDYLFGPLAKYWDAVYQKEATNQHAKADLIVKGKLIARNVPATYLLGMEQKLRKMREVFEAIHTLPPGIRWDEDRQEKPGVFRAKDDAVTMKTAKTPKFEVIVEPTDHHPAQYERLEVTSNVGKYTTMNVCGLWTPIRKAETLQRLDDLIEAVVLARGVANSVEVVKERIADNMLDFIMTGKADGSV